MKVKQEFVLGALLGVRRAVVEGSQIVEGMHTAVLNTVGRLAPVPRPVPVITRLVYESIRTIAQAAGTSAEVATRALAALPALELDQGPLETWQLHLLSAFNAAFGDHFEREGHPWALPMILCLNGEPLELAPEALRQTLSDAQPELVICIHGLGMNDLLWQDPQGWSISQQLQRDTGATVLGLRYNTGRHIFQNGQDLALLLEQLLAVYPVPLRRLTLIGHSMGGLLIRSATHYGRLLNHAWIDHLADVACLGSPHQGAVLENIGNWISYLLTTNPYSAPLSLLGRARSAGIKDLRHGSLRHEDWLERDLDDIRSFAPAPVAYVPGVRYLMVASRWSPDKPNRMTEAIGDGLVTLASALNPHVGSDDTNVQVSRRSFQGISHLGLIYDRRVYQALLNWYCGIVDEAPLPAMA